MVNLDSAMIRSVDANGVQQGRSSRLRRETRRNESALSPGLRMPPMELVGAPRVPQCAEGPNRLARLSPPSGAWPRVVHASIQHGQACARAVEPPFA